MGADNELPIAAQLGLERGMRIWASDLPPAVQREVDAETLGLSLEAAPSAGLEAALVFLDDAQAIGATLQRLAGLLTPSGFAWIGWPADAGNDVALLQDRAGRDWLIDEEPRLVADAWCAARLKPRPPTA